jgi:hypothetical protein
VSRSQPATSTRRTSSRTRKTPTVGFVSLGCPKALVDSERILTELRAEGYLIAPRYADADLVIVNTCGFIDEASPNPSPPSVKPSTRTAR